MDSQSIFLIVFGLAAASMVFKIIKNRGLKGAMFGAPVDRQTGQIDLPRRGMVTTKLKVHVLDSADTSEGPHVGVEVVHSTIGSWEMKPVSLTRAEARRLAEELLRAAEASESKKTNV
jgi:hypothetical protein